MVEDHRHPSTVGWIRTLMICGVFWRGTPLQNTVAGTKGANSRISDKDRQSHNKEGRTGSTTSRAGTDDLYTHQYYNLFQQYISSYPWYIRSHPSRSAALLPEYNKRRVGVTSGQGLPTGAVINPNSENPTQSHRDEEWPSGNRGGMQVVDQGSDKGGIPFIQPVPQQNLCGPQERQFTQAGGKPKTTESVYGEHPFQDGESEHDEGPTETRGLDGLNRFERCLSLSGSMGRPSKIPPLYVAGHHLRIPVSPIWTMHSPQSFYQTLEASTGKTPSSRGTRYNVFR